MNFFAIFFRIFYYGLGRHTLKRFFFYFLPFAAFSNLFFFSLFHCFSQPNLVRKDAMMVFSDFLNFFYYFFGIFYYGSGRYRSRQFFFSLSFSPFSNLFWLEKKLCWCFQIFWIFLLFFLEFSITGRVLTHRIDFFFLSFSAFPNLFWLGKKLWWCFLIFWIFSLFF